MRSSGRAARVRLEHRLVAARQGVRMLDLKQHILESQLIRLNAQAEPARVRWEELARMATLWLRRASALDGSAGIRSAAPRDAADVVLGWGQTMGVRYPEDPRCRIPVAPPAGGSSALSQAALAHRCALEAGVRLAAVQRAVLLLSTELEATRTRQRAVERRWIPRLEHELLDIRRQLETQELEEALRVRWAADRDPGHRSAGHG